MTSPTAASGAAGERIARSSRRPRSSSPQRPEPLPDDRRPRACRVRIVSFAYDGRGAGVLPTSRLTIEPGESVALVGATGSGKSTVASLSPLLRRATSGSVARRRRRADLRPEDLRRPWASSSRRRSCSRDHPGQHRVRQPRAPRRRRAAPACAGADEFIDDCPRLRHRDRRAGVLALGRATPTDRHRPRHPRRSPGPHPRRCHLGGGSRPRSTRSATPSAR